MTIEHGARGKRDYLGRFGYLLRKMSHRYLRHQDVPLEEAERIIDRLLQEHASSIEAFVNAWIKTLKKEIK